MPISPQGVAYDIVAGSEWTPEVRFWDTPARQRDGLGRHVIDGQPCDLMNSFKMQLRTNHQRVVRLPADVQEPGGYTRHDSGLAIPNRVIADSDALRTFLAGQFLPLGGYAPFHFPSYSGRDELLDGMWQHEAFTVPMRGQVEANIERYIGVAQRKAWSGDRRGTTLNLQVGASSDDVRQTASSRVMDLTEVFLAFGSFGIGGHIGIRFTGVSGLAGKAIDDAVLTFLPSATDVLDNFAGDWFAHDAESPPTFTTVVSNLSDRPITTATQEGDGGDFGVWTDNEEVTFTGDALGIKGIIQDLADAYDPTAIALLHLFVSGIGERLCDSYDGSTIDAPKLDITSSEPSGGIAPILQAF